MEKRCLTRCWVLLILACAALANPAPGRAALPMTHDLEALLREAQVQRVPVLLAFMQKDCPYCARARRHLGPLLASAEWGGRALMREIDIDSTMRMRDFEGRLTTPRDFARAQGIRMVPTIMVFDDHGRRAGEPVVGLLTEDFYSAYIVQALEAGYTQVTAAPR